MKIGIEEIAGACLRVGRVTMAGLKGRSRIRELVDLRKVLFRIATREYGIDSDAVMDYLGRARSLAYSYRETSEWLYRTDGKFHETYERVMKKIRQQ